MEKSQNYIYISEALCSPRFYQLGVMMFFGIFYGAFISSVYKMMAHEFITDHSLTTTGSISMMFNGLSRVLWGRFFDKYGFKRVYFVLLVVQFVTSLTIYLLIKNPILYTIWVACAIACEGGHFCLFPAVCAHIFGIQNGGQIYTIMMLFLPLSSLLGFFMVEFGNKEKIPYSAIFYFSAAITFINLLILYKFDDSPMISK